MMALPRMAPAPATPELVFCATGKSGLGHLRRIANVVSALHVRRRGIPVALISNAEASGLTYDERSSFCSIAMAPRLEMAKAAAELTTGPVVVDTAILPGLENADGPLCLILRETVAERLNQFKLAGGREWDLVCVPNPADHWLPSAKDIGAKRVEAVGWIFRSVPVAVPDPTSGGSHAKRRILVASGGGGTEETASWLKNEIDRVLGLVKSICPVPIDIVQVVGPRLPEGTILDTADECLHAGPDLNLLFGQFDLVISTAGYNSVLELAGLDVPALLVPIKRGLDDQAGRCAHWASKLGSTHSDGSYEESAEWISETLAAGRRRTPVHLNPSGAFRCADLILGLLP